MTTATRRGGVTGFVHRAEAGAAAGLLAAVAVATAGRGRGPYPIQEVPQRSARTVPIPEEER
jgi:hypothetical protein